jgi:surface antigen
MRGKMRALKAISVLATLVLAGCVTDSGPQQTSSIPYTATANSGMKVASAGVLGNGLGSALNDKDRQRAYAAEVQALEMGEPGEPVGWKGLAAGRYGTVVPGAYYETRGVTCRDYSHTIFINGRPEAARATACRTAEGTWAPVG